MAQPISIGDAYLLAKLSWRIGRALSSGRKAAATEIGEVQNQLFALGKALDVSSDVYSRNKILGENQSFQTMLSNCRETLRHLEKLMEKYKDVDNPTQPEDDLPLRLKETVIRNWTKIKWTTKGGDVSDLRDALGAHINAINLTLSALNLERGREIELRTGRILQIAEEMYLSWKHQKPAPATASKHTTGPPSGTLARATIYIQTEPSKEPQMICPRALVRLKCVQESPLEGAGLFECACEEDRQPHAEDLSLRIRDSSFLIRTPGQRPSWEIQLYSEVLGRTVQAIISNLAASKTGEFEEFIHALAFRQGENMINQGISSPLAFIGLEGSLEGNEQCLSVLKMQAKMSGFENSIAEVTFDTSGTMPPLTLRNIQSMHLLHYFSFPLRSSGQGGKDKQYAELSFEVPDAAHGHAASRYTVQVHYFTEVDVNTVHRNVFIDDVLCAEDGDTSSQLKADVQIHFDSTEAAENFASCLRLIQAELFLSYLRSQRVGESLLFTK
ncbi:hypothetical protein BFW01_g1022 [Lasiodiplodia theobromae]|uniref:Uncharacterized protein n=1 Tax=Lasiodiplodia theobromae TaxID=45133 RepID=A0A8H7IS51_9PEZI|nr:hypothetical protein BFW01_g1022 [Lasiodiplodia theobromae]